MKRSLCNRTAWLVAAAAGLPLAAPAQTTPGIGPALSAPGSTQTTAAPRLAARELLGLPRGEDLLRGNGSRIGYVLTHGGLVPGSESVYLDGVRLSPGSGYALTPETGSLTLTQPVRPHQSLVVRYRYRPATGAAGTPVMSLPLLTFRGVGGGSLGLSFAIHRAENGQGTASLLGLRAEPSENKGFSGLLYLSGKGSGSQARSLLAEPQKSVTPAMAGHLIDQSLTLGGARSRFSIQYQNVSAGFAGFAALRGSKAASEDVLSRLEKEKGLTRLGFSGNLGIGGTQLGLTHSDLSEKGAGITRQGLKLNGGSFSLAANYLAVSSEFTRFKDIADPDRAALEKLRGGKKFDLSGQWAIGRAFKIEGNLLEQGQAKDKLTNARTAFALTPGKGSSFSYLREFSGQTKDGKRNGTSRDALDLSQTFAGVGAVRALRETVTKTENNQTTAIATRLYELGTDPNRSTAFSFLSRSATTKTADKETDETLQRFGGKTFLGVGARGLALTGLQETLEVHEAASSRRTATSLFGFRTQGLGALSLRYDSKKMMTTAIGAEDKYDQSSSWEGGLQLARNTRTSFSLFSAAVGQGAARTTTGKQAWSIETGRGFLYRQSLDLVRATDGKKQSQQRSEFQQFALDPAARITGSGERKTTVADSGKSEISEKWNGRLALGGLSLKTEGYDTRRVGMDLKSEKAYGVDGKLLLARGWSATYTAFDRANKDEKTKKDRSEVGSELMVAGRLGTFGVALKNAAFDNRLDKISGYTRREVVLTPLKPISVGPLKKSNITVAYSADTVEGNEAGRTRRLGYDAYLGPHRIAFEYADGIAYRGPDTLTKSFLLDSDPDRRIHVGLLYKVRNVQGEAPVFIRSWDVDLKISDGQKFTYDFVANAEKPDGTIDKIRSERAAYVADLGGGGKLSADYKSLEDFTKRTLTRGASFSLLSPTSEVTAYELQYIKELTVSAEGRQQVQTYVLKYLYQPASATKVEVAARWVDRHESKSKQVLPDEAQANIDVKLGL